MDHLQRKRLAMDTDSEDHGTFQTVRDGARHATARLLRRLHKPRKRIFWGNQNCGIPSARSIEAV